jgi:hypothetical protein
MGEWGSWNKNISFKGTSSMTYFLQFGSPLPKFHHLSIVQ